MSSLKEQCYQFGSDRHLTGIITESSGANPKAAVVLVNAGLVPKFGPFRLYAELARRIANENFLALRFDLGGIGDSMQYETNLPLRIRTKLEICASLDYLTERQPLDQIVLAGLCSGAEDSFRYAEHDPRVTKVILVDPFCYPTTSFSWRHFLHRLSRRSLRAIKRYRPVSVNKRKTLIDYKYMEFEESSRILKTLIERKVEIHFVYTGGMNESFNHKGQLKEMFNEIDFKGLVTIDHFPQMDHTQVQKADRTLLIEAICQRLTVRPKEDKDSLWIQSCLKFVKQLTPAPIARSGNQ